MPSLQHVTKENIDAVVVATVDGKPNLVMHWNGETIVDLERRFLDTNGVRWLSMLRWLTRMSNFQKNVKHLLKPLKRIP